MTAVYVTNDVDEIQVDSTEESEHLLMKEREILLSRLHSNEKKMHVLRHSQVR